MYRKTMDGLTSQSYPSQKALLKDYQRLHISHRVYPGLIHKVGATVEGMIYMNVNAKDMEYLNQY